MCNLRACCYEIRLYLIPPCDGNCIRCKGAQDSSWSARGTPARLLFNHPIKSLVEFINNYVIIFIWFKSCVTNTINHCRVAINVILSYQILKYSNRHVGKISEIEEGIEIVTMFFWRGLPDGDVERLAKSTVVREVVVGQCRSSCVAGYHGDPEVITHQIMINSFSSIFTLMSTRPTASYC